MDYYSPKCWYVLSNETGVRLISLFDLGEALPVWTDPDKARDVAQKLDPTLDVTAMTIDEVGHVVEGGDVPQTVVNYDPDKLNEEQHIYHRWPLPRRYLVS